MSQKCNDGRKHRIRYVLLVACLLASVGGYRSATLGGQEEQNLTAERALAATISETRMVETVRRLVGFGTRAYGSPSNHEAAAWLAATFRESGLEVTVRQDTPRNWYQPVSCEIRTLGNAAGVGSTVLKTSWPFTGSPSGKGEGELALQAAPGAVCLISTNPTPDTTAGCAAVLFDGRASVSGWPNIRGISGTWTIPVLAISPDEAKSLRKRLADGEKVRISFALEARSGNAAGETVVATLPGKDRSKYVLFCAHGDSDSGGPGANDNASGVATMHKIMLRSFATPNSSSSGGGLQPAFPGSIFEAATRPFSRRSSGRCGPP